MKFGVERMDNWNMNSEGVQLQYLTLFNHSVVAKRLSSSRPPVSLMAIDIQLLQSFSTGLNKPDLPLIFTTKKSHPFEDSLTKSGEMGKWGKLNFKK